MRSRQALTAVLAGLLLAAGPAWAQGDDATPGAQAVKEQQIDLALGTLAPSLAFRPLPLQPPAAPGTRGPQPFDQEPPAAQSDFSDVTVDVCPRGPRTSC